MKKTFLSLFLMSFLSNIFAQKNSYDFEFHIKNCPTTLCKLGYYKGETTVVLDSMKLDSLQGKVSFKGNTDKLVEGQYFFLISGVGILDFIVNKREFKQKIYSVSNRLIDSARVEGSRENLAYFEYLRYNKQMQAEQKKIKQTINTLRGNAAEKDAFADVEKSVQLYNKEFKEYAEKFNQRYNDLFVTKMVRATVTPTPPDAIGKSTKDDGTINMPYHVWLNRHFWDNFDFTEPRFLYTKLFSSKMLTYFDQYTSVRPDSIVQSAKLIIDKCSPQPELRKFAIQWLTQQAENRKSSTADNILVYLVDNYYKKEQNLTDDAHLQSLNAKAENYRPNLIGKIVDNFELPNANDSLIRLNSIKKRFTVVYMFDPFANDIEKRNKTINEAIQPHGDAVALLAVAITENKQQWIEWTKTSNYDWINTIQKEKDSILQKNFNAYPLPVIYILDENKKILGKNVRVDDLARLIKSAVNKK